MLEFFKIVHSGGLNEERATKMFRNTQEFNLGQNGSATKLSCLILL